MQFPQGVESRIGNREVGAFLMNLWQISGRNQMFLPGNGSEGTGRYPTRKISLDTEKYMLDKVTDARKGLQGKYQTKGNMAYAKVEVDGIEKMDFYGHSKIYDLSKVSDAEEFSPQPTNPIFKATEAPNKEGDMFLRDVDSEYKILNDIANRLGDNTEARGTIKIFTELDTCDSCNKIIKDFAKKYKNIVIDVVHNE